MPIARPNDFVETYRLKARLPDLHELTGRGPFKEATRFIVQRIAEALEPGTSDTVVDIGCGDGSLLLLLSEKIGAGIGVSSSDEEVERLRQAHSPHANLRFIQSLANQIDLPDSSADRVVCNSVFHFLPTPQHMFDAVKEFARIARPGARIFIGEIPFVDEQQSLKGNANPARRLLGQIRYNLRAHPWDLTRRAFRYLLARLKRDELFIIHPKKTIYMASRELTDFASGVGLELLFQRLHVTLDAAGRQIESDTRIDYLFRKRSQG